MYALPLAAMDRTWLVRGRSPLAGNGRGVTHDLATPCTTLKQTPEAAGLFLREGREVTSSVGLPRTVN